MPLIRRWLSLVLLAPLAAWAQGSVVETAEVRAELVAHAPEGVAPGKPLRLGLLLQHAPHWHTYWKNPGDSGLPTSLEWQLPPGMVAGAIQWPTPQRLPAGPLVNYGYEGAVLLQAPFDVPVHVDADRLEVRLRADWLACRENCIPQSGEFALSIDRHSALSSHAGLFESAQRRLPREHPGVSARAEVVGRALVLAVSGLPGSWRGRPLQLFVEESGVIDHAAPTTPTWQGDTLRLQVPLSAQRSASPASMRALLQQGGETAAVLLPFTVAAWPAVGAPPGTAADAAVAGEPPVVDRSVAAVLLFAFLGGLLLNLMPCVFPVLSLKVLAIANQGNERPHRLAAGLAYTGGVLLSFVALAGLLLMLRAGGAALGWGFQLQSPGFVVGLAVLCTLIGLNLLGVFELSGALTGRLGVLRLRHPLADHALTGVFAVVVASPCTAPFMGAALGVALTLPPAQALAVFATLGLGMAAPFLAASLWSGLGRLLPRPGPWMAGFKALLAFPMFATVVWLLWVLGHQVGVDGVASTLALLLLVAFAAWAWGSTPARSGVRLSAAAAGALAVVVWAMWAPPAVIEGVPAVVRESVPATQRWTDWSADRLAQLRSEGRPVFVDFTAAWCVTCQFNKRTTLSDPQLLREFDARGVQLLRADWTRRDEAIATALRQLGRSGVPVYALYAAGATQPQLLSEMPSVSEVRDAMARWGPPPAARSAAALPIP